MDSIRKIANSSVLEGIFDIPENLKNKKVVITISAYEDTEDIPKKKSLRGSLSEYKDENLRKKEENVWEMVVFDKHENS